MSMFTHANNKSVSPTRSTWQGASRFATNKEELTKVAITRQEYQEQGSSWAARKFAGLCEVETELSIGDITSNRWAFIGLFWRVTLRFLSNDSQRYP